jgi:flagellar biosynthesis/type III secretory pathway protein FliH
MLQLRFPFTPHSRAPMMAGHESKENGWAMTEKEERLARDRAEIAARVANFRETQQKFERAREEYYETTLANAVNGTNRPSFWR